MLGQDLTGRCRARWQETHSVQAVMHALLTNTGPRLEPPSLARMLSNGGQHCMLAHTQVDHRGRLLVAGAARAARAGRVVQAALALGPCMQTPHLCKQ